MTEKVNEPFNQNTLVASFVNLIKYEREEANSKEVSITFSQVTSDEEFQTLYVH